MGNTQFIEFKSTLPDDSSEDANGNVVIPAGKNVSLRIAELLIGKGLNVTAPKQHSFYGWELVAKYGGGDFLILLQWPGDGLIILRPKLSLWEKLTFKKNAGPLRELSTMLIAVMSDDDRFSEVRRKS